MGEALTKQLEPIAQWFTSLGTPESIVHWGHPVMMGIVVFTMGSFTAYAGWKSRTSEDKEIAEKNRLDHRKLAPFLLLFITLGYTGGVLSLVMQHHSILESPHFWTGSIVILLLGVNSILAKLFPSNPQLLRTAHAYLGSVAMIILFTHAFLGLNLGLSF